MATKIEKLNDSIEKAQLKVEKSEKTIERHEDQLTKKLVKASKTFGLDMTGMTKEEVEEYKESNREAFRENENVWDLYEIIRKFEDIEGAKRKLAEAERVLKNWEDKLAVEIEADRYLEDNAPEVIMEFIENWKRMAYDWHVKRYEDYQSFKEKLSSDLKEARREMGIDDRMMPTRSQDKELEKIGLDYKSIRKRKVEFAGSTVMKMDEIRDGGERLTWLDRKLEAEKKAKLLDLVYRLNNVIGETEDASDLRIGAEGNLNGIVIGKLGRAKIETVGAGGWNIQCFHFRTLLHKLKD